MYRRMCDVFVKLILTSLAPLSDIDQQKMVAEDEIQESDTLLHALEMRLVDADAHF